MIRALTAVAMIFALAWFVLPMLAAWEQGHLGAVAF